MTVRDFLAVLLVASITSGCGLTIAWRTPDTPTRENAASVLLTPSVEELFQHLQRTGIPNIPMRTHVRPCCAFGHGLKARLGLLPLPGFSIGNIKLVSEIGSHRYDSGLVMVGSDQGQGDFLGDERNGLIFTCRGGFIDTAHVRDYSDWTIYLAARIFPHLETGIVFDLPDEGGRRRITVAPVDPEILANHERVSLALSMAGWLSFRLSVWHEIATWAGWSWSPSFPEKDSAFSPEDLYSNLVGIKIATAIALERSARSASLYDRSVDAWFREVVQFLRPTSKSTAIAAMDALDGVWWDSTVRLPDAAAVRRRNFSVGPEVEPWLVPDKLKKDSLREDLKEECGRQPAPLPLPNSEVFSGSKLEDMARLEIDLDDMLAQKAIFSGFDGTLTQADFGRVIAAIQIENRELFGPRANRPD